MILLSGMGFSASFQSAKLIAHFRWHSRARELAGTKYQLRAPLPVFDLGHVLTMLRNIDLVPLHLLVIALRCFGYEMRKSRNSPNGVKFELETIQVVEHHHIEWSRGSSFFLIAADVNIVVIVAAVGELVNQSRIAVISKDHRLVGGEDRVEI